MTLNEGRGQFYGEKRFSIQPLRNNGILVRKKAGFHGQVIQIQQLIRKKAGFHGQVAQNQLLVRKKAGFHGQTRDRVSRTDADCGLTDKRGLRFTDRRSSDFPDTCHLDFRDTRHLNFPDASYLTKRPKSGITYSAQKTSAAEKWSNLQTSWQLVVKKMLGRKWEQGIHIILRQSQYTADLTIGRTEIIVQFLCKVKFLWTCQVM